MSYHLDYVSKPERFDEVVEQEGVKVIIDSKALFSIIGSEMDWEDSRLASRFVFSNPNIKDACGKLLFDDLLFWIASKLGFF
jgi:iron-sulfur cluster assembly accessory protein